VSPRPNSQTGTAPPDATPSAPLLTLKGKVRASKRLAAAAAEGAQTSVKEAAKGNPQVVALLDLLHRAHHNSKRHRLERLSARATCSTKRQQGKKKSSFLL
jgi:hypothetical protein